MVVMEAMLAGWDEGKGAFDQAITVLTDWLEACDSAMAPHLPELLDRTRLQPPARRTVPRWRISRPRVPEASQT